MKVLFDTNVVLDVLLARESHAGVAARLFTLVDNERIDVTRFGWVRSFTVSRPSTRTLGAPP